MQKKRGIYEPDENAKCLWEPESRQQVSRNLYFLTKHFLSQNHVSKSQRNENKNDEDEEGTGKVGNLIEFEKSCDYEEYELIHHLPPKHPIN